MNRSRLCLVLMAFFACHHVAMAHFLFIRVINTDKGKHADVYFSEGATAGDPTFIDRIAGTKLWTQTQPGKFEPLKVVQGDDRLRATLPTKKQMSIIGICEYGVLARKTPFLLRHFPKAVVGDANALSKMKRFEKVPLEIQGQVKNGKLHFQVLHQGKPLPGAKIHTVDKKLKGTVLECDAKGRVSWKPPRNEWFMAYVGHFQNVAGEHGGKKYKQIRDFATFSFEWPIQE